MVVSTVTRNTQFSTRCLFHVRILLLNRPNTRKQKAWRKYDNNQTKPYPLMVKIVPIDWCKEWMPLNLTHILLAASQPTEASASLAISSNTWYYSHKHHSIVTNAILPDLGIFNQESRKQVLGILRNGLWKLKFIHKNHLKQDLGVSVEEWEAATHHLVHDNSCTPPIHCTTIVIIF